MHIIVAQKRRVGTWFFFGREGLEERRNEQFLLRACEKGNVDGNEHHTK